LTEEAVKFHGIYKQIGREPQFLEMYFTTGLNHLRVTWTGKVEAELKTKPFDTLFGNFIDELQVYVGNEVRYYLFGERFK